MNLTHRIPRPLEEWAAKSQQRARRNAMVAATELARLRTERVEVQEFLEARTAPTPPATAGTRSAHG